MLTIKFGYQELFKLLFTFYSLIAVLSVLTQSTSLLYTVVCLFTVLLVYFLLLKKKVSKTVFLGFLGFLVLLSASILIFYNKTGTVGAFFPTFFFLYLVCFYVYFKSHKVSIEEFLKVINYSYVVYFFSSIFCYLFMSDFYRSISLPGFSFRAFHGIEGSPANIDSFSTFVILINFFFNQFKSRFLLYGLASCIMLFSGTVTPILIFLVVMLSAIYLRLFRHFSSLIILFVIVHVFMLYLSLSSEYINDLLGVATNGRNFIWNTQLDNMTSYSILWSDVEAATVPISWSIGETNNSHNAFLFLIFRIGGLSCLLLFLSFFIKSFKSTYHNKLLLMAFLAAGISNSNMLYIGNPIYFYIVFFALFYRDEEFS